MDTQKLLPRDRLQAPKASLRKVVSTNNVKRNVLGRIENSNNLTTGKVLKKSHSTKASIIIQPSKENIKLIQRNIPPTRANVLTDKSRLTRLIKYTISATKGALQSKNKNESTKSRQREWKPPLIVKIPDGLVNIDDGEFDPLVYNEYAPDVIRHLRQVEMSYKIRKDFLSEQSETNGEMRADLVDWIHRNASRFELYEETFYLAVAIIDLYLQHMNVPASCLPLLGMAALMIACKYEEVNRPSLSDLVRMGQLRYSKCDILNMERSMLKMLDFKVGRPVPIQFLRRYSQANKCGRLAHNLSKFFLELSLLNHSLSHLAPSLLATAASCLSLWVLLNQSWTAEMEFYSGYTVVEVAPVTRRLARFVQGYETLKNQAVRKKFSGEKYFHVSRLPQLSAIVKCFP